MRRLPKQTSIEWLLIVSLIVGCLVLSGFQYHWTSEVSRATTARLRSGFAGQVQLLGRAFDEELFDACNQLLPENEPITAASREAVHAERLRRWRSKNPRPIFRRLGVAVPENSALQLYWLDQQTARLTRAAWPPEWKTLHDNLALKVTGGSGPPFQDPMGTVIEFPIFRDHLENEWMIFELDLDYIAKTWLPDLANRFLNQDGRPFSDVTVHPATRPETVIYAVGESIRESDPGIATVRFNGQGWGTETRSRRGEDDFWILKARQRPGALERLVAVARWRNFILGGALNVLPLLAGFALLRYARRARRVSALHMRFVANASHELRTPLTVIRGAGQNLARGVTTDPARVQQYGQFVLQHADHLNHLVEQMLALADVRRLSATPKHEPISLQEILQGAIASTLADTRAAGCKVEADILSYLPRVNGDASALRQVFQNLLTNAAKYAASGGWIGVKTDLITTTATSTVEVRVEDRGPGIAPAEQSHIFEPFARGASAREHQIQGSGLGLSMVQEIVRAHGGLISLQSTPGRGTAFIVRLPALREKAK